MWLDSVVALPAARLVLVAPAPVPDSATVVGLFVALLVTVREPVRVPEAVGLKLTVTEHEPPAAIDVPQVLVWAKSPETETPETVAAAVPVFVTVTEYVTRLPTLAPALSVDSVLVNRNHAWR